MQPSRHRHRVLAVAFVLTLAVPPAVQVVVDLAAQRVPGGLALFMRPPTAANLRSAENDIERESWFAAAGRPLVQQARFFLFADPGQDTVAGRDGWFFYAPGLQYLTESARRESDSARQDCLAAVCTFRDQLAARGIHLIVVPAPGKASVYPDKLTARMTAAGSPYTPTRDLIAQLTAAGVDVVDLFEAFAQARQDPADSEPLYLAQDTHWSPHGVRVAAQAVAERVLDSGRTDPGTIDYTLDPVTIRRLGDIIRMARAPALEKRIAPESVDCLQVIDPRTGKPYRDEDDAQVLVLGDSFLRIYESDEPGAAGFISHLARCLKRPIASIVNDGGASTLVRQTLSRRPELLENKKVVIWEFVERDIRFGTEGWQPVNLPPPLPSARGRSASGF